MKILVTGGTGFLGRALAGRLEALGHEITCLGSNDCDLTRGDSLERFNALSFDRVFHLAAWTQAGDFCLNHAGEQWLVNQKINTHTLSWWQRRQPQAKMICMGTSCAYDPALPASEGNYLAGNPIESLLAYAMTKRMLYAGLLALHKQFGLKYLYVVPSTLYGPGYPADGRQRHFIFDVIHKIVRGKFHGDPVVLWGDGHQKRELVFVDDFVRILLRLADERDNDIVNVGAGEEFTIRHFARLVCDRLDYDFERIRFDASRYVGARSKCLEIRKLRGLVRDLNFTPMETGLSETIDWFAKSVVP